MSVSYYLENRTKGIMSHPDAVESCFGRMFWKDSLWARYKDGKSDHSERYNLSDFEFINYKVESERHHQVSVVMNQFPWMKDIVSYDVDAKIYSFDLSKPADTVWFCLNLVRLIHQPYNSNFHREIEKHGIVDIWKMTIFLNSYCFGKTFAEKKHYISCDKDISDTCVIAPIFLSGSFIKEFVENPLSKLNKLPSVIEAKSGFKVFAYWEEEGEWDEDAEEYLDSEIISYDEDFDNPDGLDIEGCYYEMLDILMDNHVNRVTNIVASYTKRTCREFISLLNLPEKDLKTIEEVIKIG